MPGASVTDPVLCPQRMPWNARSLMSSTNRPLSLAGRQRFRTVSTAFAGPRRVFVMVQVAAWFGARFTETVPEPFLVQSPLNVLS